MISRLISAPAQSFFLFGPRGSGKSLWVKKHFSDAPYFDLLASDVALDLQAAPHRLGTRIPPDHRGWVVIDEVQKIPDLLDEVHRLIESRGLRFVLTGSSARKLRRRGVNLLAGRAVTRAMHPLTAMELGDAFDLRWSLAVGQLPVPQVQRQPALVHDFLRSYVETYLREEVLQEGLTRNLGAFTRFLEASSFSQAQPLNISAVARDGQVERKVVESYFGILEDLLLAVRVPVFARRAKRSIVAHPKFFFFDAGVFRAIRPKGPLDSPEEIDGAALETLVFQELRAINDYLGLEYKMHYWRTHRGLEVDFVLYGERGLHAFEVKPSARVRDKDLAGLRAFLEDYPMARARLLYMGDRAYHEGKIEVLPVAQALLQLGDLLKTG